MNRNEPKITNSNLSKINYKPHFGETRLAPTRKNLELLLARASQRGRVLNFISLPTPRRALSENFPRWGLVSTKHFPPRRGLELDMLCPTLSKIVLKGLIFYQKSDSNPGREVRKRKLPLGLPCLSINYYISWTNMIRMILIF